MTTNERVPAGTAELGMVGLGVMGRNLLLNLAEHGFPAVGCDLDPEQVRALEREGAGLPVRGVADLAALAAALRPPRAVLLLVPAGAPVDRALAELGPHLAPGDLVMDGGNSHFRDSDRRAAELEAWGLAFLGLGVSGGERGARRGPSLMAGGPEPAYRRVAPLLEAVAARAGGEPCVARLGSGSAGHFVKMVHNGIEYALMELLAEAYALARNGLGLDNRAIRQAFLHWQEDGLDGYLMEITAAILARRDPESGGDLLDAVLGVAGQKGTGMWTSQAALELQVPVPTLDAAVAQRDLSALADQRGQASSLLARPREPFRGDRDAFLADLGQALHAGAVLAFAQGMALLQAASTAYGYGLVLAQVARVWRGGCIIRTGLLEPLAAACARRPGLANPLLDAGLAGLVRELEPGLRATAVQGVQLGESIPGLLSALAYLDGYRSAWLPANLIQAQRDCFGAHGYQRVDRPGRFHSDWESE